MPVPLFLLDRICIFRKQGCGRKNGTQGCPEVTGSEFSLSVSDKGIGISPADQQHLFERFFRASNATNIQGTGLGLHIVAKYVELMNGSIHLNSELEKGTSFTIRFKHS